MRHPIAATPPVFALRLMALLSLLLGTGACSTVGYYAQSLEGHMDLMARTESVDQLLQDARVDSQLRQRLRLARAVRRYASEQLALPDNDSYKSYADLQRPYAVWNVIATQPFSVDPEQWCFLFVGCLQYRGYFDREQAETYAAQLQSEGYDVYVAGARAYSTLGWFDDPLLNTMLEQSEARLIGVIFHELAHQQLYVKDDSAFNEAFATTVEREGVRRWYRDHAAPEKFAAYLQSEQRRRAFHELLLETRNRLARIYARDSEPQQKRRQKRAAFDRLQQAYARWRERFGYDGYDEWMARPLNNAHLALVATYNDLVPHFQALLKHLRYDLPAFYAVVGNYADKPKPQRHRQLKRFDAKGKRYARDEIRALE